MNKLYRGDSLKILRRLPDESVQCCVTSPPYFGLRDYGTATWQGGDAECEHKVRLKVSPSGLKVNPRSGSHQQEGFRQQCPRCGARRIDQQLGLEPTPSEYVARMVEVFREVRRVLRPDGTLWLNIGDSYASNGVGGGSPIDVRKYGDRPTRESDKVRGRKEDRSLRIPPGLKAKDLVGIPWRLAFALQADGWYLRSDIIWHKPNPMPESVRDRPTKAHEYIFLLTKSPRYFFDAEAVREEQTGDTRGRIPCVASKMIGTVPGLDGSSNEQRMKGHRSHTEIPGGRNIRSVWTITPRAFRGAHFATFPPALVERCVKAGSKPGDTVLDPFIGSGTTAAVARSLGRDCIGIDLNPKYLTMARARIKAEQAKVAV